MWTIRKADARGVAEHGWLSSRHTFSFADYYDPRFTGFRDLLVINEDRVAPGRGFGTHGHRDMEIVSYVLEGALEHADSMGNGSLIVPGEVQRMTAGTGVRHSEYNHSKQTPVHFLQIWIRPEARNLTPGYEQKAFAADEKRGRFRLIASRDGREGSVTVHQDVSVYAALLDPGVETAFARGEGRHLWLQIARGAVEVNGQRLDPGDGLATDDADLKLRGLDPAEVLLFDLA
ncbi:MAG: pirin family protein [Myxococcales bacterium]|nr:pirin family protein [Myxococcales bacterium]